MLAFRRLAGSLLAIASVAFLAGCTGAAPASSAPGGIRVEGAWARPSMGMDRAGAAYLVLVNESGTDDALVGASSPAAASCEIHETSAGSSGMMAMHPVDRIPLPAGGRVALAPGGYHIMLIGLTAPLTAGSTIELTLRFASAPPLTVTAEVRAG